MSIIIDQIWTGRAWPDIRSLSLGMNEDEFSSIKCSVRMDPLFDPGVRRLAPLFVAEVHVATRVSSVSWQSGRLILGKRSDAGDYSGSQDSKTYGGVVRSR